MEADETLQHKMFLSMSHEALAEARQYYQTKYQETYRVNAKMCCDIFIEIIEKMESKR